MRKALAERKNEYFVDDIKRLSLVFISSYPFSPFLERKRWRKEKNGY